MADQITPAVEPVQTLPTGAAAPVTPVVAAPTPTVAVDMEAIQRAAEARAERAAQAAVKDMLKQQGLDDAAVKTMLDEWKAKQTTPEQELRQRDETIGTLQQQLDAERQEKSALAKGVPIGATDDATKAKVSACMTLAKSYMTAEVPFEAALDKALAIISFAPQQQRPAPMYGGTGTAQINLGQTVDDYKKMSYTEKMKLKDENPGLYDQFKKALGFK